MKTLIYISLILISGLSVAQNEILTEHEWELEYIELNGETYYQPNNEESEYPITISFYESPLLEGLFGFQHNLICGNAYACDLEFVDDNTFDLPPCIITLAEGCSIIENVNFQSNYIMIYQEFSTPQTFGPFNYTLTTENDIISLTITNSLGDSATYSATTLGNSTQDQISFTIYPNPASNLIYFKGSKIKIQNFKIFNINGQQVLQSAFNPATGIDVSHLTKGVYFIKVDTKNGSLMKKFIKN